MERKRWLEERQSHRTEGRPPPDRHGPRGPQPVRNAFLISWPLSTTLCISTRPILHLPYIFFCRHLYLPSDCYLRFRAVEAIRQYRALRAPRDLPLETPQPPSRHRMSNHRSGRHASVSLHGVQNGASKAAELGCVLDQCLETVNAFGTAYR